MTKEYRDYLLSFEWRAKKDELIKLYKHRCCNCGSDEKLEVHHMTYINIFYEKNEDLRVLCSSCHKLWHLKGLSKPEYKKIKYYFLKSQKEGKTSTKKVNLILSLKHALIQKNK